jgi:putative ABC transport system permease protein
MLRNYLHIAFRNLRRQPGYTITNVVGLAVGIACVVLIALYVHDEWRYDRHHEHADRIFRITTDWAPVGPPVGQALAAEFPEIEAVARFTYFPRSVVIQAREQAFREAAILYADGPVFEVFTHPLLRGDAATALAEPFTVVLTESVARRYFGDGDPIGEVVLLDGEVGLRITGVMADQQPTHLPFELLVSMPTFYSMRGDWVDQARTWGAFYTYLLLHPDADAAALQPRLDAFSERYFEEVGDRALTLQPLTSIHLHSRLEKEWRANSDFTYVLLFSLVALLVLMVAGINYTNLATAQSVERAREVGVRKTLGAHRGEVAGQFLVESVVLAMLGAVAALALASLALPLLASLSGKTFADTVLLQPAVVAAVLAFGAVIGLGAGAYPAFALSGFRPVQVLKGRFIASPRGAGLRKGLVVCQFAVSVALIAATVAVYQQVDYLTSRPIGFDKEQVLVAGLPGAARPALTSQAGAFRQSLERHASIAGVSLASDVPGERFAVETFRRADRPGDESQNLRLAYGVDDRYLRTLGAEMAAGRDFDALRPGDTTRAVIMNEAAVRALGLEDPIGAPIIWRGNSLELVGVVRDFHFASLHHEVEPLVILHGVQEANHLLVRATAGEVPAALEAVRAAWAETVPGAPFDYVFLDASLDNLYRAELRMSRVFLVFAALAVLLASLGVLGLAAYMTARRRKEIGVRKVLGAGVAGLVGLLSRDFLALVLVGFVAATPVAYLVMSRWLEGFAYRIDLGAGPFLLAGALAFGIALLTVCWQAFRAATADPVQTLRSE